MKGLSDREILEAKALGILFDILVLQHATRGRIISRQFLANFDSLVVTEAGELTVAKGGVTVADANGPSRVRKMVKGALFAVVTGGALAIAAFGGFAASNAPIPKRATPKLRESYQNYLDLRRALGQSPIPPDPADIFLDDNLVKVQGFGKEAIEDLVNDAKELKKNSFDVLKFEDQEYKDSLQNEVTANERMILLKQVTIEYDQIKAENHSWYGEEPGFVGKVWRAIRAKDKESYKKELESLEQEEKRLLDKIPEYDKNYTKFIRKIPLENVKSDFFYKELQDELIELQKFKPGPDHEAKMDQAFKDQLEASVIAHLVNATNLPVTSDGQLYKIAVTNVVRDVTPLVYAKCKEGKENGKTCSSLFETIELYRDMADDYFRTKSLMGPLLEVQDIAIRTRILIGTFNSTIKYVFGEDASHPTLDVLELELENFITTLLLTGWKDYGYWTAYGVSISIPTLSAALIASYGYKTMAAPGLTGEATPALEIDNVPQKPGSDLKDEIIVLDESSNEHFIPIGKAINLFFNKEDTKIAKKIPNFKQLFIQFTHIMYACYSSPKHTKSKKIPFPFGFSIIYSPRTKTLRFSNREAAIVFRNTLLMILKTTRDEKKLKPLFVYDAFSIFVKFALGPFLNKPDNTTPDIRSYMKESYSPKIAGPYYRGVDFRSVDVIGPWVNGNTVDPEGETVGERLGKMEVYLYNERTSTPLFTKKGEDAFVAFYGDRGRAEKFDPEQENQELVDYLLNLAEAARLKIESPKNLLT